jgi:PKD repeat protein
MDTNVLRVDMRVRFIALVLAAAAATGCTLNDQEAPELSGPSGLSLSLSIAAAPDHLMQDGSSQAVITATARDAAGAPISGLGINWSVSASDGSHVEPTAPFSVTNAQGQATTRVTAPAPPAQLPPSPVKLRVSAQAQGVDASTSAPGFDRNRMTVEVELVPPAGTPSINRNPVASFTIVPVTGNVLQSITFDASATTDEGTFCGSACTYRWDFGDFTTDTGMTVSHSFTLPQTYQITLTVTDARGGVASARRDLVINGPAAPVAAFTVAPISSVPGVSATVNLDGTASTVGSPATIVQYAWTVDTDPTVIRTTPGLSYTLMGVGGHSITLTVTDSLGRTASKTSGFTVQ